MTIADHQRAAALAALDELPRSGILGLGTGSTVEVFLECLAEVIARGRRFVGVPTSEVTRARAIALGIPLLGDDGPWSIAVAIDGADEVDAALDLIKGGGGAHAREKIVSFASAKTVIIVDDTKRSARLGERRPVPIEVLAFGHLTTRRQLERFGEPCLRHAATTPVRTPAGNHIYDLAVEPIADPGALEARLCAIPGVVATGLFVGYADVVLVGSERGVERLTR